MGDSFVLFDVSIVISHRHFHCGNRGHTQNTDFPWVRSNVPVGKRSSGTAAIFSARAEKGARVCVSIVFSHLSRLSHGN